MIDAHTLFLLRLCVYLIGITGGLAILLLAVMMWGLRETGFNVFGGVIMPESLKRMLQDKK